ncbi:MAG: hypothetical protein IAX22_05420 [Candidatus Bathyarchaeota archaeon]|nr:hypothetical protein [Candidatus Bathyarchaeota archaeon]
MKKNLVVLLLVINVVLAFTPVVASAETLAKPTVTLPTNWELVYETPYPDSLSEHDPLGAGLLEYQNLKNQDGVMIYYEKAPTTAYTDAMLKAEAEEIFRLDHFGGGFNVSGVRTVAGVKAGYAEVYVADYDIYDTVLVFIKDSYYINAYVAYDANNESRTAVESILNSISVGGNGDIWGILGGSTLAIIVGLIVIVVVVIVVAVVLKKKKLRIKISQSHK